MSLTEDFQRVIKQERNRGRCLHFANGIQCNKIISAHSIQKQGQLSLIAEEGHVYQLNADFSTLKENDGIPCMKRIGVKNVSTFRGFCKYHDNQLFEPIDNKPLNPDNPDPQQIPLYAYRSLCREFFVTENAVKSLEKIKDNPKFIECNLQEHLFLNYLLVGKSLGFERLKCHKYYYEEALRNENYDEFEFVYLASKSTFSLQLSGLLDPDVDFLGQHLQDISDISSRLDLITFFTATTQDGWAFCFAWHRSSNTTCIPFIESLFSCVENGEAWGDVLLRFALPNCENHAVRISWWDNLPQISKQQIIDRIFMRFSPVIPVPPNYLTVGLEGIVDWRFDRGILTPLVV